MSTLTSLSDPHLHSESSPYTPHYRIPVPRYSRHTEGVPSISATRKFCMTCPHHVLLLALPVHARHRAIIHIRKPPELLHLTRFPRFHHWDGRGLQRSASIRFQTLLQRRRPVYRDFVLSTSHPRGNPTDRWKRPRCRAERPTRRPGSRRRSWNPAKDTRACEAATRTDWLGKEEEPRGCTGGGEIRFGEEEVGGGNAGDSRVFDSVVGNAGIGE